MRPRECHADDSPLLDGGSCPSVPHDPAHERAPRCGFDSVPAGEMPATAHGGEVGEQGRGWWSSVVLQGWGGELDGGGERLGTGARPF